MSVFFIFETICFQYVSLSNKDMQEIYKKLHLKIHFSKRLTYIYTHNLLNMINKGKEIKDFHNISYKYVDQICIDFCKPNPLNIP